MIRSRILQALAVVLLSACASRQTVVPPPVKVEVPVPVSCLPSKMPTPPRFYSDDALRKMDEFKLVLALWHNADMAQDYIAELEAILRACR